MKTLMAPEKSADTSASPWASRELGSFVSFVGFDSTLSNCGRMMRCGEGEKMATVTTAVCAAGNSGQNDQTVTTVANR